MAAPALARTAHAIAGDVGYRGEAMERGWAR
jgi:hypothetical protein